MLNKLTTGKKLLLAGLAAIVIVAVPVLIIALGGGEPEMEINKRLSDRDIPTPILVWLEGNKSSEGFGAFYYQGFFYFAARMGEKPTGGYSILLGEANLTGSEASVFVDYKCPSPWDMVTQVITYPRTVIRLAHTGDAPETALFLSPSGDEITRVGVEVFDEGE